MNKERGSAILILLIAVFLFAALAYAFTQGSRTNTSMLTAEQLKNAAVQIIDYGNDVQSAVQRLKLRGCKTEEISFENNVVGFYTNPSARPDGSCNVFSTNGGGLQYMYPPAPYADPTGIFTYKKYGFMKRTEWAGNGTTCGTVDCTDILIYLEGLDSAVCTAINTQLGYATTPTDSSFGGTAYTGTFDIWSYTLADEPGGAIAAGQKKACFYRTVSPKYIYAVVLLAR